MRLWIDNTGLQSAAACIDGRSPIGSDREAKGLLQFATQIVFGDIINFNGFESDHYRHRSEKSLEIMRDLGVTSHVLAINNTNADDYFDACLRAAESAARSLAEEFQPRTGTYPLLNTFEMPRDTLAKQTRFMDWFTDLQLRQDYEAFAERAKTKKSAGAVEFMVASSQELRNAIRSKIGSFADWSFGESYGLASYLRLRLNRTLSKESGFSYCPALERSELIAANEELLLNLFTGELDKVTHEIRGEALGIPTLFEYLVLRSKGDPKGVIREALELRQKTVLLRERLQRLTKLISLETYHDIKLLKQEIAELGAALRSSLNISDDRRLINAIRITFVLGVPTVSIELGKAIEWLRNQRRRNEVSVLADVVRGATLLENSQPSEYQKLLVNASRRTQK